MPWLLALLPVFGKWIVDRLVGMLIGAGAFGVAYVGVNAFVTKIVGGMVSALGSSGVSAAYNVLMIAGFGVALNVILSACVFALTLSAANRIKGGGQ